MISFDDVEKVLVGRFMALEAFCCILMCFSCSLGFFPEGDIKRRCHFVEAGLFMVEWPIHTMSTSFF